MKQKLYFLIATFLLTLTSFSQQATHLNFDGVDDYIELANESNFDFTNQMTVEFWMNSNTFPDQWDALVAKGDNSWRVTLTLTGTVAFTGTQAFSDFYSITSVTDGNWHHVAVTYDGVFAKIYIDGSLESQLAGTSNINNSNYNVALGENLQMTARKYGGSMDEVRIWNTARTIDQINASKNCELQGNEVGLVAYYQFNQGVDQANNSGITTLIDATTNANNGTLHDFTLNGATSNWLAGSPVTTGSTIPTAPTATNQNFCSASSVSDLVPAISSTINWYASASSLTPLLGTDDLVTGTYYVAEMNANGCESSRTAVDVSVSTMSVSTSITNVSCNQNNDGSFTLTPSGGISPYTYLSSNGSNTATVSNLVTGTYVYWVTDDIGCVITNTIYVTEPPVVLEPTVSSPVTYNQGDVATALTATIGSGGTGLLWYTTATGGTGSTTAPTPSTLTAGTTSYWVSSTNNNDCESARVEIVVIVNAGTSAPTTTWATQVYTGDDKTIADIQVTGSNITWYDAPTGGSVLASTISLLDNGTVYASQTIGGVESTDRLAVTVKRISDNTQMLPSASTVANLVTTPSTGTTAQWFVNASGGTALPSTDVLADGVYFVEQVSQSATVSTFVGTVQGNQDGDAATAQFYTPNDVVFDPSGNMYVADYRNHRIRKVTPSGVVSTFAGSTMGYTDGNGTAAQFRFPTKLAFDLSGDLLVCDANNNMIRKISPAGDVTTVAGSTNGYADGNGTAAQFSYPNGIAVNAIGEIFVSDQNNNRIRKIDAAGNVTTFVGDGTLNTTDGVGTAASIVGPAGMEFDTDGNLIVIEYSSNGNLRKITPTGDVTTIVGGFAYPEDIAIDNMNVIYVADTDNSAIKKVDQFGTVTNYAGGTLGDIDGDIAIAEFGYTAGLTFNANELVFCDMENNKIKKIASEVSNRVPVNVDITTLGTSSFDVNSFKIYPNPSTGIFTIDIKEKVQIEVYNFVGKLTLKQAMSVGSNSIDISNYSSGMYLLKATNASGSVSTYKIIKE